MTCFSLAVTSQYAHFLSTKETSLKGMIKAVVRDQEEAKEQDNKEKAETAFSSKGGGASVYSIDGETYRGKNKVVVFPDVKAVHRELPGVSDAGDYDASLFFRGGGAHETTTLINGHPISDPVMFDGKASLVNPQLIKKTKVYTSGMPVWYPDALSGIVDVEEREGDKYVYHLELDQSLIDFQLLLEGPMVRGYSSFVVSVRRTYYDYLLQMLGNNPGIIAPHMEAYAQKFFMKLDKNHEFTMDFKTYYNYYKLDNSEFNLGESGAHSSTARRNLLSSRLTSHWGNSLKTELVMGMENSVLSRNSEIGINNATEKVTKQPFFIKAELYNKEDNGNLFSGGLYYKQERLDREASNVHLLQNYDYPGVAESFSSDDYSMEYPIYAAYLYDEFPIIKDKFFLETGVRYSYVDHWQLTKASAVQPRIGLRIENKGAILKFSAGKYAQYSEKMISTGFVDLYPEEAMQYNLGIEHNYGDKAQTSFTIFKKKYSNLVMEEVASNSLITGYNNNKKGEASGIELAFRKKKADGWKASVVYTQMDANYSDPLRGTYSADHEQKHSLSFSGEMDMGDDFGLVWDLQCHSGKPYTDLTGATSANVRASYLNNPAKYNKSNFPWYSNLTITLQHQNPIWPFDKLEGYSYIGITNAFNLENIYDYVWNDTYTIKTAVKMMSATPLFGVHIRL